MNAMEAREISLKNLGQLAYKVISHLELRIKKAACCGEYRSFGEVSGLEIQDEIQNQIVNHFEKLGYSIEITHMEDVNSYLYIVSWK